MGAMADQSAKVAFDSQQQQKKQHNYLYLAEYERLNIRKNPSDLIHFACMHKSLRSIDPARVHVCKLDQAAANIQPARSALCS